MNGENIVVLGGSFSPPTVAHLGLMCAAMDTVNACRGLFVPTPFWYVERKMKKMGCRQEALPNEVRLKMLEAMCQKDERLGVNDYEMNRKERGFTYETLQKISNEHPGSQVFFLAGSDKLHVVPRWHRIREFVQDFKILVAKRNGEQPEAIIAENQFLNEHRDAFVIFPITEKIDSISSSEFRDRQRQGDMAAKEMVTEEVWKMMQDYRKTKGYVIDSFREEYSFLSNFYPAPVEYKGLVYQNSEAAFQAQKCLTNEEKKEFCCLPANMAKRLGRQVSLREDWEAVKLELMEEIVRAKFMQNPDLANKLLATGQKSLIEGNNWNDRFWGVDSKTGQGENHLGRILIKVRDELKQES